MAYRHLLPSDTSGIDDLWNGGQLHARLTAATLWPAAAAEAPPPVAAAIEAPVPPLDGGPGWSPWPSLPIGDGLALDPWAWDWGWGWGWAWDGAPDGPGAEAAAPAEGAGETPEAAPALADAADEDMAAPALAVSDEVAGAAFLGGSGDDSLAAGAGADTIIGWAGEDTIVGGRGADQIQGGPTRDLFAFAEGDSGVAEGRIDQILDWSSEDTFWFLGGGSACVDCYLETAADTYAEALALANGLIMSGARNYVAVQVGGDTILFADTGDDDADGADDAILLVGRSLDDIGIFNVWGGLRSADEAAAAG